MSSHAVVADVFLDEKENRDTRNMVTHWHSPQHGRDPQHASIKHRIKATTIISRIYRNKIRLHRRRLTPRLTKKITQKSDDHFMSSHFASSLNSLITEFNRDPSFFLCNKYWTWSVYTLDLISLLCIDIWFQMPHKVPQLEHHDLITRFPFTSSPPGCHIKNFKRKNCRSHQKISSKLARKWRNCDYLFHPCT